MTTRLSTELARPAQRTLLIALCAGSLLCCDKGASGGESAGKKSAGPAESLVEKAENQAIKEAGGEKLFDPADKEFRKRACEFLNADMVSGLFEVPAAELKQIKVMGCIYSWKKDDQVLEAKLMMIRAHKTEKGAATWFQNATATKTKEQLDAEMEQIKAKVQERKELDTKLKKKTAAGIADIAKMGTPDEGVRYNDVPGIGDEARVSDADGVMWVRIGNLTFQMGAYKGPGQPKVEFDPKNPKAIIKASMAAQKKWLKDTLDQRKKDVMKLAPPLVKAIAAAAG